MNKRYYISINCCEKFSQIMILNKKKLYLISYEKEIHNKHKNF